MKSYTDTDIYVVEIEENDEQYIEDYTDWCKETFEEDKWIIAASELLFENTRILFMTEQDRNWFMMRWG